MLLFIYSDRDENFRRNREARDRQSREDGVSTWCLSVMMAMVFLILVMFLIEVMFSKPEHRTPIESAWYCHALPLFNILGPERPGSVLPLPCHTRFNP